MPAIAYEPASLEKQDAGGLAEQVDAVRDQERGAAAFAGSREDRLMDQRLALWLD